MIGNALLKTPTAVHRRTPKNLHVVVEQVFSQHLSGTLLQNGGSGRYGNARRDRPTVLSKMCSSVGSKRALSQQLSRTLLENTGLARFGRAARL